MDSVILIVGNVTHEHKNMIYFMPVAERIMFWGSLMYLVSFLFSSVSSCMLGQSIMLKGLGFHSDMMLVIGIGADAFFVDWENEICDFESEEFQEVLEYLNNVGSEGKEGDKTVDEVM